jgi:hypothetical protein
MTTRVERLGHRPYVGTGAGGRATFDRLFAEAAPLVSQGEHQCETPPLEGGRWPVSIVLRPDRSCAERLEKLMTEAERSAGPGHFRTGTSGSAHFTVRVLERYREAAGEQDEAVRRYAEAMGRAAGKVGSIALDLVGLTLSPGSIMVCAQPVDESGSRLMDLLRDELKDDGWREAGFRRDIWYANILHFAADIARPATLVEWVEERRDLDLGHAVLDVVELVRFRYEDAAQGRLMRPQVLSSVRTGSSPGRELTP